MHINSKQFREQLIELSARRCSICGQEFSSSILEISRIVPLSQGGEDSIENFMVVCPTCHIQFDNSSRGLREYEFVDYLVKLMQLHNNFRNVQLEMPLGKKPYHFQVDIFAEENNSEKWLPLLIETKSFSSISSRNRVQQIINQMSSYKEFIPYAKSILAFPGSLSPEIYKMFEQTNILIWDMNYIANMFSKEIEKVKHPFLQPLLLAAKNRNNRTREDDLISQLKMCIPGKESWVTYQKLVGTIFEKLFCPPLSSPISELSDALKVNRRDFILPNYAENGYWFFLRSKYFAEYIVIDAKNYIGKVKKKEILQITNYLKPHGAGLFGIITCRNGIDYGGSQTQRELWILDRKLVVILTDENLEQMLILKKNGSQPEDILKQIIEDFRLSL